MKPGHAVRSADRRSDAAGGVRPAGRPRPEPDGAAAPELGRCRRVVRRLFGAPGDRTFAVRYWDAGTEEPAGDSDFTLVLAGPGALRRILLPPTERSVGEAYVRGHVDVEGDLESAVATAKPALERLWSPRVFGAIVRDLLALPRAPHGSAREDGPRAGPSREGVRHSPERDARAVRHHYDVGNDFYRLWLDRWMQYSTACFEEGDESLAGAQEKKLDLVCRRLRLEPGERLLDVGCG